MNDAVSTEPTAEAADQPTRDAFAALPRHVAIIMDGNGRWAQQRDQPRMAGHQQGAASARKIILEAARLGLEALTLYSFSTENWKRPAEEVDFLMNLGVQQLRSEEHHIHQHNIRFVHVGSREGLSADVLSHLDRVAEKTAKNTGMTLGLALNYGARAEIAAAVQQIAEEVAAGELDASTVTERTIAERLYTASMPDPDLLIRTAGEMRLSNFLLWQISYAELWVTPTLWPDFNEATLHQAIHDFAGRQRRFGAV
ncbi:MAG: isoprenyl transferase [Phycisphaeraceae bacterium]